MANKLVNRAQNKTGVQNYAGLIIKHDTSLILSLSPYSFKESGAPYSKHGSVQVSGRPWNTDPFRIRTPAAGVIEF